MEVEVTLSGLDDLEATIQDLAQQLPDQVSNVMSDAVDPVKEFMDSLTPVRTGRLKEGNQVEEADMELSISNDVEYAPYVNYGTRHMHAQPFFEPTVDFATQYLEEKLAALVGE